MSTLAVNTITAETGNTVSLASGKTLNASQGFTPPAGHVIQTKKATGSQETSVSGTGWVSTYAEVGITPSSTSSKIYLMHTAGGLIQSNTHGQSIGLRIKRVISGGATSYPYSSDRYHYADAQDWHGTNWAVVELDSPNTTSLVTYTIQLRKEQSSGYYRHCDTATWNFVAMEIAG